MLIERFMAAYNGVLQWSYEEGWEMCRWTDLLT